MRGKSQTKGIFCIEGLWDPDLRVGATVRPLLELLRLHGEIAYIHREAAMRDEVEFYLDKWVQKRYEAYPILYLTGHGEKSGLKLGDELVTLDELGERLAGRCKGRVIMFSSCSTLGIDKRPLKSFLEKTDALAVCGYRVAVDWMRSTAFELLLFSRMQDNEFSGRGVESIQREALDIATTFNDLDFRMLSVKELV